MKKRFPAPTALVAALALGFAAPTMASDAAPTHLAQASSGSGSASGATGTSGGNASAGSNDSASSTPAMTGRPDAQRSTTPNHGSTTRSTAGTTGATTSGTASGSAAMTGNRNAAPSANPGNAGFRNWWNDQAQQHDGRITRDQYDKEMDRRWRAMDRDNRGLTAQELDRLHGWSNDQGIASPVQPGATETHNLGRRPESDNAQAK